MKLQKQTSRLAGGILSLLSAFVATASFAVAAQIVTVQIDTTPWEGTSAQIALDLVGEGSPTNSVDVTSFQTNGVLGNQTPTGAEAGTLPGTVTLQTSPSSFFNEELANITLGSYVYFRFSARVNVGSTGAFPDEFSFFILDNRGNPLATADPTGANALGTIDLTGGVTPLATSYSGNVTLTQGAAPAPTSAAPDPPTWTLITLGSALLLVRKHLRRMRSALPIFLIAGGCVFAQNRAPGMLGEDSGISVRSSGLRFNRITNTFDATVTLVNVSSKPIEGPFYVGISGITDSNVSLANAAGMILEQIPYIPLSTPPQLAVGQAVMAGVVKFNNPLKEAFQFDTSVWDAASVGGAVNMNCPQSTGTLDGPGNYTYAAPVDHFGRQASCVPAPGSFFPLGGTLVQCVAGGAGSPYMPGYCNFQRIVERLGPGPGINLTAADLALGPCLKLTPAPAGEIILSGANYSEYAPCATPLVGTGSFSVANYGPFAATNVVLTLGIPKQYISAYAVKFTKDATCQDIGPAKFPDGTQFTQGDLLACTFATLNSGEVIQATVGFDSPANRQSTVWPTLNAYVSSDTPDPDKTNNAISFNVVPPVKYEEFRFPGPPIAPQCRHDPDDHTFGVLIDTCGAPPLAVEIVTTVFLGAAGMVTGVADAAIVSGVIGTALETNTIFRCSAAQVLHLLVPVDDPEL